MMMNIIAPPNPAYQYCSVYDYKVYAHSGSLSTLQRCTCLCAADCTVLHFKTETPLHVVSKSNDDMTDRVESRNAINVRRYNNIEFPKSRFAFVHDVHSPPMLFSGFIPFIIRLGVGDL